MKNLYKLSIFILSIVLYSSCSKDYLQTSPTASAGTSTIFETVQNMELAVNGLYKCMTQQYGAFGQGYNGEGTIKYYLGNFGGNNFNLSNSGNIYLVDQSTHTNPKSTWGLYPWYYYYRIIANANAVISYGPDAVGAENKRDYLIAQAKVMRAYCYLMLAQRFTYRWGMGKSGEVANGNGLVLRTEVGSEPLPLSSAKDVFAQIYKDLDEAIAVLGNGAYTRKADQNYEINTDVAYAVYARAALVREDYNTALTYAKKARANYNLMSNKDYKAGFNTPNSEWIWSSFGDETETLYYYSFFAYMSYNANTSTCRNYPRSISKILYNKIPSTDIRKSMFLDPEDMAYSKTTGIATSKSPLYNKGFELHPEMPSTAKVCAYHQFKFACLDGVGVGHLNHFRSSEMILIEAEANYFLGNETEAQKALVELTATSGRDPEYTCTKTGEDLFNEIKLYRGIELWGEGFEWFDLKRWNDKIDRKGFNEGGNSGATYAITVGQEQVNNWWTSVVPERETLYNPLIK